MNGNMLPTRVIAILDTQNKNTLLRSISQNVGQFVKPFAISSLVYS